MADHNVRWAEFANRLTIADQLGSRSNKDLKSEMVSQILFFNKDETVKQALEELTYNRVVSAPVYDDDLNKFIGFVDVLDLACYCADKFPPGLLSKEKEIQAQDMERQVMDQPVTCLIDKSGRNKFMTLDKRDPIARVFATLSHPDIHRVAIIDQSEPNKVLAIITQYEVARWLWQSRNVIGFPKDILLKPAKSAMCAGPDLVLIPQDKSLLDAFRLLKDRRVSGLGVTNQSNQLVGNVSASDVKVMAASALDLVRMLGMRLDRIIELKRTLMLSFTERVAPPRPITVTGDATLEDVLEKLVTNHIHRVWVTKAPDEVAAGVEQQLNEPIGVISLTDIARLLSQPTI